MRPLALLALSLAALAWLLRRRPEARDESRCDRCGGRNPASWHAPSPLWNEVVRTDGRERWGFLCPTCFIEASNERVTAGRAGASWCVRIHDDIGLPTVFGDGRVWDADRCMWVDDPADDVQWDPWTRALAEPGSRLDEGLADVARGDLAPLSASDRDWLDQTVRSSLHPST